MNFNASNVADLLCVHFYVIVFRKKPEDVEEEQQMKTFLSPDMTKNKETTTV